MERGETESAVLIISIVIRLFEPAHFGCNQYNTATFLRKMLLLTIGFSLYRFCCFLYPISSFLLPHPPLRLLNFFYAPPIFLYLTYSTLIGPGARPLLCRYIHPLWLYKCSLHLPIPAHQPTHPARHPTTRPATPHPTLPHSAPLCPLCPPPILPDQALRFSIWTYPASIH